MSDRCCNLMGAAPSPKMTHLQPIRTKQQEELAEVKSKFKGLSFMYFREIPLMTRAAGIKPHTSTAECSQPWTKSARNLKTQRKVRTILAVPGGGTEGWKEGEKKWRWIGKKKIPRQTEDKERLEQERKTRKRG